MEILTLKDEVKEALTKYPHLRNSDAQLAVYIWKGQTVGVYSKEMFFGDIIRGQVSSYDSITRVRRKLQQIHPELRGIKAVERLRKLEEEKVKKELKEFENE